MVSALPPIPAARASSAYFFPATWALQLMTEGSKMALSRPWGTWNMPPRLWDMAWHRPSPAWVKAMPAMVDARCTFIRTAVFPAKEAGSAAKALEKASRAYRSVKLPAPRAT